MKRFKKELSWLLVAALVFSSLVVGLGQLKTEAVANTGTGLVRVSINIKQNDCTFGTRGTDSSFRLQFIDAAGNTVGATPDNAIEGRPEQSSWGDPLEADKTTTFGSTAGAGGNVQFIAPSLGAITVNHTINRVQLVNTYWEDDWRFNSITVQYSWDGGSTWVNVASGGEWTGTSAGAVGTWNVTWFASNYKTLTFAANGGSGGGSFEAIPGQTITNPGHGTRTGYTFSSWSPAVPARMPNSNATYNAAWNANTYTVAYNANGGTGTTPSSGHTYNATNNLAANAFARTGHTFHRWNTEANGTGTNYTSGQTNVGNLSSTQGATVTLYAIWTINSHQLTVNPNGGVWSGSSNAQDFTQNYNTTRAIGTPDARTGYNFVNWTLSGQGSWNGSTYTYGATAGSTATLTANWSEPLSYTVTFDANGGGTPSPTSKIVTYNSQYGALATTGRIGYTFNGWYTAASGGTKIETTTTVTNASNHTLYAQWAGPQSFAVTFNANNGSGSMSPQSITFGQSANLTANAFNRTGYTFAGWNTQAGGGGASYANQANYTMNTEGVTLYAQWTINKYTVSFNSNGGSAVGSITEDYGTQISAPTAPTKTGNTFAGWYSDSGLTNAVSWPYTIVGDVTFYAKWTVNNYSITFNAGGGTGGTGPTSMAYGSPLTAPTVNRTGYTFDGWDSTVPATVPAANTTYTAQWVINQYTVSFNSNGGSAVSPITQNYNTSVAQPAAPTKTGNTFVAWYSDEGLTTAVSWPYTLGASNVTFYAKWTVNSYYITFNANGGTGGWGPTLMEYGAPLTAPTVTLTGNTFSAWSTTVPATVPAADTTYTAQWGVNAYTISFDSAGGSETSPITQDYGTAVDAPDDPTRTGYTFNGWNPAVPPVMPAENIECVAQWSANTYYVTFDANGGSGTMSNQGIEFYTSANLTANAFSRTGYSFNGWNTAANGSGTTYADQTSYGPMGAAGVTLYAQWSANTYYVIFNANGGSGTMSNQGIAFTQSANLTANDFSRTEHVFTGWNTAANGSGVSYGNEASFGPMLASDITLYAQWTINKYSITFNSNGGSAVSDIYEDYNTEVSAPAAPTKPGNNFAGWYSDSGLTTVVTWPYTITGNVTFYAKWTISAVNITFDANGGTGGTGPTSMEPGTALTAPAVTRQGYVLTGWSPTVPATVPTADATYTAQWELTVVSVTLIGTEVDVNIKGWTPDTQYQIWTYQQVESDLLLDGTSNVQANQWILAQAYAAGSTGDIQLDGSISFTIPAFTSPTENYLIAVRIADSGNNFIQELRDAYTPAAVQQVVITKILVDNVVTAGYELREIKGGAQVEIQVIGNNVPDTVFTATMTAGPTPMPLTMAGNELTWDISSLAPGIYTIVFTATNGTTTATETVDFELYSSTASTDYGLLDEMILTPATGIVDVAPTFDNGTFSYRVREPGRGAIYRSNEFSTPEDVQPYATTAPGIYHVYGYVTRAGFIGTEQGGYDDGMIRTLVIPRTGGGTAAMTFTANQTLPDVEKGTPIEFTANATGLPDTVEYSFWRYDATGYILVKDWSTSPTLTWTPARIGTYTLEARAKGDGAGSYEVSKQLLINVTATGEEKAAVTGININAAYLNANAQAKKPIMITANATSTNGDDLLYKFMVYDDDMRYSQLKGYTIDQNCVWTPRKAGMTYKISVMVKNQLSFGKFDAIETFEITVD